MANKLQSLGDSIVQAIGELGSEVSSAVLEGRDAQDAISLMQELKGTHDRVSSFGGGGRRKNMAKMPPIEEAAVDGRKGRGGRKAGSKNRANRAKAAPVEVAGEHSQGEAAPKRGGKRGGTKTPKSGTKRSSSARHYQRRESGTFSTLNDFEPFLFEAALEIGEGRFVDWQNLMRDKMDAAGALKDGDMEKVGTSKKHSFLANSSNLRTRWLKNGWIAPGAEGKLVLTDEGKKHGRNLAVKSDGGSGGKKSGKKAQASQPEKAAA